MKTVAEAVYAKCDASDGVKDGLIDDPRRCGFDPARRAAMRRQRGQAELPDARPGRHDPQGPRGSEVERQTVFLQPSCGGAPRSRSSF
jgi:hypothetical protein